MKKFFLLIFLSVISSNVFSQDNLLPVVIDGDEISYLHGENEIVAKGNVRMKYKGTEMYCDEADYNAKTQIAHLKGNIKVVKENAIFYGNNATYDFNTQTAQMADVRMESSPIYGQAKEAHKVGENEYILKSGYVSTCDLQNPHYRMVTKSITVYPGEKVVAKNMILKIGAIPVFYIPYFSQSLKQKQFPFQLHPGSNKEWGKYALTLWRYDVNPENKGRIHYDWYENRGKGIGLTHKTETAEFGNALIKGYFLEDKLYDVDKRTSLFDFYDDRQSVPGKRLEDDRYRADLSYKWKTTENLNVTSEFHKFSDEFFRKDFFYPEYEDEPNSNSYVFVDYALPYSGLSLLYQKRVNRFQSVVEYLPQLEYNLYTKQLGSTNFCWESRSDIGGLSQTFANSETEHDVSRFFSHNTLSYPTNIRWLELRPFMGNYAAFYSRNAFGNDDIWRTTPETGMDLSTKLYKNLDISFNSLGEEVAKMRHIITPSIGYKYIHPPTVSNSNIFQFDGNDSLSRSESVVFTLENKLQAKNEQEVWDFVYFSPAVEYLMNQEGKGSYFNAINTDLDIIPKSSISLNTQSTYSIAIRRFSSFDLDLSIGDEDDIYDVTIGHRYTRQDSSQGRLALSYKLTPKLALTNNLLYEYNTGDLIRQEYGFRVDLHCWWMDLGVNIDRKNSGVKDYGVWITFINKAFPDELQGGFDRVYRERRKRYPSKW